MTRLLVINDEADLLEICRLILEPAGYAVETVAHARKDPLLDAVHRFAPDLILLDLVMPAASGEDVARWLRADPTAKGIPLLIMSALSDAETRARYMGASGFMRKPFTDDALLSAVARTLGGRKNAQAPA
jgi:DNA-binding response OmpR family regulator